MPYKSSSSFVSLLVHSHPGAGMFNSETNFLTFITISLDVHSTNFVKEKGIIASAMKFELYFLIYGYICSDVNIKVSYQIQTVWEIKFL